LVFGLGVFWGGGGGGVVLGVVLGLGGGGWGFLFLFLGFVVFSVETLGCFEPSNEVVPAR